jgi:Bacterial protein of unknown function (Gcw_chp)
VRARRDGLSMKVIRRVLTAVLGLLVSSISPCPLLAEETYGFSSSAMLVSDYVWRGYNLYDGLAVQPTFLGTLTEDVLGGSNMIYAEVAGLWSLAGEEQPDKFSEIDFSLGDEFTIGDLTLSGGVSWYRYPDPSDVFDPSSEIYAAISYETYLKPRLTVSHDYKRYNGTTLEGMLSESIALGDLGGDVALVPSVHTVFSANGPKLYNNNGLTAVTYGLSVSYQYGIVAIEPGIFNTRSHDDWTDNEWWTALTAAVSF